MSRVETPRRLASSNLLPGSFHATTSSVFLLTDEVTRPPCLMRLVSIFTKRRPPASLIPCLPQPLGSSAVLFLLRREDPIAPISLPYSALRELNPLLSCLPTHIDLLSPAITRYKYSISIRVVRSAFSIIFLSCVEGVGMLPGCVCHSPR